MGTQLSVKNDRKPNAHFHYLHLFNFFGSAHFPVFRTAACTPSEYSYFFSSFGSGIARTVWITLFSTFMIFNR